MREKCKILTVALLICNYRSATARKYTQNDKATNTRVPRTFTGSPLSSSVRWIPIGTQAVLINLLMIWDALWLLPQQRKLPIGRLIIPVILRSSRLSVFSQRAAGWDSVWCFSAGKDEHPGEVPDIPLCADDRRLRRPDCPLLYQWSRLTWCRRWVWDPGCSLKHSLTWDWWQLFPDDPEKTR